MSLKHWVWGLTMFSAAACAAPPLRVAVSTAWAMPVGAVESGNLQSGIVYDVYQEIGQALGREVKQVVVPRKRLGVVGNEGEIDLRCHATRGWVNAPEKFEWTRPLYTVEDVLFGSRQKPAPESLAGVPGHTSVTTVLGYSYPALDALFASGRLVRDDSPNEAKVLQKVTAGRAEFGVVSSIALHWYRKSTERHGLANWELSIESTPILCAIPKAGSVSAKEIREAIDQLIRSGKVEKLLARYR